MAKVLNRNVSKEDIQMVSKHMKGCSISSVMRELQTKTIVRCLFIPTGLAASVGEDVEKREPSCPAGGKGRWHSCCGKPSGSFSDTESPCEPAAPLPDVSDIRRFLSAFHEPHAGLIQAAQQLLCDEQAPQRQRLLADLLHNVSQNIAAETRAEDPPWFEGLESRFQSKSGYLRYSCESRIRSYLREVSSYPSMVGVEAQEEFLRVLDSMCQKLRSVQYNGSYFDRGAKGGSRLCTPEGWFSCQGPFDMDSCLSRHSINPYSNRESRILFGTWNLDHIIEKKRAIIPTLVEAIKEQDGREVDWEYFYGLLFTSENLKLVHVVCHKKTTHKLSCDPNRIYKRQTRLKRMRPVRKRQ
nr:DNA fragmentation factor subunit beta isoform X1 [Saimiri boliviensis boliviensis]